VILRAIRVANWRCFVEPVAVGPFDEGLNVLHAPNATGKSTLLEALLRGLLDGHRVGGREVEPIRPWGRLLAPTITVEFAHSGTDYKITKRFLDGASSKLERKENGQFVRLAEADNADEMVRKVLMGSAPGRGLARHQNWGLAQILWTPQGELALEDISGDVIAHIRASLDTQVAGPGAGAVEKRVEEVWRELFAPGGKLKAGKDAPALVRLTEKLQETLNRRTAARAQQQDFDEAVRRVEDLRARRAQARYDEESISEEFKESRSRAEFYRTLLSEKMQRAERLKAVEAQHGELKQRAEAIKSARRELKEAEESLRKLEADIPLQEREVGNREEEAAEAKAALEDARRGRQMVDAARELSEEAHRFGESNKALGELSKRLGKISRAQETLAARKREKAGLAAPDAPTLRAIRQAMNRRDEARLHVDAALITLEVVPERDGSLEVISGDETGTRALHSGRPTQMKGSPEVVADLPGVARFRAWGPTGSIEQYRSEQAGAERRIKALTEPFGTTELEELEKLGERAEELDKKIAEVTTQLETLLSSMSIDDIRRESSRVEAVLVKSLERHPNWKHSIPDGEALKTAAQESSRSFIEKVEGAEARRDQAQSALAAATTQGAGIAAQLKETRLHLRSLESRLAELISDGKTDREREDELKKMALAWEAARVSLDEVESRLSVFGDDPMAAAGRLEKRLEASRETATRALEDEKIEEGKLQHLSAQGPYSALALVEEEAANLKQEIAGEELRVNAINLIHKMVAQCRTEALAAVAGPVEAAATRILQRIAGERLGRLQLGESFKPAQVRPEISESAVSLENVSGGEEEQIYLATRLALAEVLAKEERQLVVLDDVLAATDAGRMARVMTILKEAAQHLQVLILTCHPERYRRLVGAKFIDLEGVVRGDRI